jgi:hypothetical protein
MWYKSRFWVQRFRVKEGRGQMTEFGSGKSECGIQKWEDERLTEKNEHYFMFDVERSMLDVQAVGRSYFTTTPQI